MRKRAGLPPLEVERAVTEGGVKRIRATAPASGRRLATTEEVA